jgi:predicted permease
MMHTIRMAWRGLRRAWGLSALIVGMLALGTGAATAIFSLGNVLLFRPVAGVADPARVISVERAGGVGVIDIFSYPDYLDIRDYVSSSAELAAFRRASFDVRGEQSERVRGALVSGNYFDVLGVRIQLGRALTPADDGANVAVIGDACWRRLFGADPAIVGGPARINGHPFTIVGVLAPPFSGTYPGQIDSVYIPLSAQPLVLPRMSQGVLANRNSRWVQITGRLHRGTSADAATVALAAAGQALAAAYPGDHAEGRLTMRSGLGLASDDRVQMAQLLSLLGAAAVLLLTIACGNAANLLLARAHDRSREMEIRRALGAGTARLAAELLMEGAMLACASGILAVWIAPLAIDWLTAVAAAGFGIGRETLVVDWRAGVFAIAVSGVIAIVFTVLPLHGTASTRSHAALRGGGRTASARRTGARSTLVALQIAFSVALAIGAGLALRTMGKIAGVEPGYATRGVVTAEYALDLHGYSPSRSAEFFTAVVEALRRQPGVTAASWSTAVPPVEYGGARSVFHAGQAPSQQELQQHEQELGIRAQLAVVGPEFFETMGIAIRSGRGFLARDGAGAQAAAIVNQALAERLWPGQSAVGRFLEAPPYSGPIPPALQIVGVAENTRHTSLLRETPVPVLYLPFLQAPDPRATLVVRSSAATATVAAAIRAASAEIDRDVPAVAVQDISDYDAATLWEQRSVAAAFGLFAACGLVLAAIGVYAALAHDVASRRRELAIRVALGASTTRIARLVLRHALTLTLIGASGGVALALAGSGRLRGLLFGIDPRDPIVTAAAPATIFVIAVLASAIPARRAAATDPGEALRSE